MAMNERSIAWWVNITSLVAEIEIGVVTGDSNDCLHSRLMDRAEECNVEEDDATTKAFYEAAAAFIHAHK